jgi:hypothetical protein
MNEIIQKIYEDMSNPQRLKDQSPPLGLLLNSETLKDIKKWDQSHYVDWRIKFLNCVPMCFIYHDSIDKALNELIHEDSYCPGCGKDSKDCPEYCPLYEEWFWTTGRYKVGMGDD